MILSDNEIEELTAYEIVKLQTALRMAAGLISTLGDFTLKHPQGIYDWLIDEAEAELKNRDE